VTDRSLARYAELAFPDQIVIDRLCSRYEAALRAGQDPSLEEYVAEAEVGDRACLLTELVVIDHACHGRGTLSRDSYVARFPDLATAIDEAFQILSATVAGPPAPRRVTLTPPALDGYEVLDELGRGGMGVVYKARHLRLKRLVALKLILQGEFASEHERARFLVETEMLGRLRHPNIVQVFEAGQQDGRPFLALEYIEGGTLAQRLAARGALAPREAAALVAQLARAIQHAHAQGVIHRDIKSANVLLAPAPSGPVPKITDFGVACQPGGGELSQTGQVIGTPAYMPPEQARGERQSLGPPADVYSLGAVLYEALTGQPPFKGATPLETVRQVLNDEPIPPARLRPGLDADLCTICLKCLSKEPEGRYASALALAEDLDRWLAGEPIAARPAGVVERAWKWVRRKPTQAGLLTVSVLLVLAVIGIPTIAALRLRHEQEQTRRADESRRLALIQSLHTAAPESVPFLVEALAPAPEQILPLLRQQLDDPVTRIRAAVALTLLGDDQTESLATEVLSALPTESVNLARAFRTSANSHLADELDRRGRDAPELRSKIRYAILLLDLGDVRLARSLLATEDPNQRSAFLEEVQTWHGTLAAWPAAVDAAEDEDLRSALCAALGRIDPVRIEPSVRASLAEVLGRHYQSAPDPGTHAAAEWSLRQWRLALPALPAADGKRRWFVNRAGLTMLEVPPGLHVARPGWVSVLARPYYVGDRKVTFEQFRQYLADPAARWLNDWGLRRELDLGPNHPVCDLRLEHALMFCNWLSAREGRQLCYRIDQTREDGWACDFAADGYRLPTEAEWDYAHRAGAKSRYFFGDDARWLTMYGHVGRDLPAPCGSKLPNRWGLFDVVGNLWEATGDAPTQVPPGVRLNPGQDTPTIRTVKRGGGYASGSGDCVATRRDDSNWYTETPFGFRVVCGSATPTKEPLPGPKDGRDALALLTRLAGDDPLLLRQRGELHGRYSDWRAAAADFSRSYQKNPFPDLLTDYAPLLIQLGDQAAYRSLRQRLLDQYEKAEQPLLAMQVARACLLAEGADLDRVFRMLDSTRGKPGPANWAPAYSELARGMAEYRRGDHAAALACFERCRVGLSIECMALRSYFLAMAHHRLGKHDEAAKAYEQGREILARLVAVQAQGDCDWKDVLRATIAEAEAKKLLESRPR
jgi:tetratricopeptide (TPR) repeat protein/tRNA A-37 threonylcarbamoyl transferase component Bud32